MTHRSSLAFLDSLVNYESWLGAERFKLDNIRRLLELAGHPNVRCATSSSSPAPRARVRSATCLRQPARLQALDRHVRLTARSDVRERIQLDGKPIPKSLFASLVARLAPFVVSSSPANLQSAICNLQSRVPVSYFEMTTAMAFLLFAERRPDYRS